MFMAASGEDSEVLTPDLERFVQIALPRYTPSTTVSWEVCGNSVADGEETGDNMQKQSRLVGAVLALAFLAFVVPAAQERVKKKQPKDFKTLHTEIGQSFTAGNFGSCMRQVRELTARVSEAFEQKVFANMPPAPAGYTKVPQKKKKQGTAIEAAMIQSMAGAGNILEQRYQPTEKGKREVIVTSTSNSPMMNLFSMWVTNPAMAGPNAEVIAYEQCKAILKTERNITSLTIKLENDLIEAKTWDRDGDFLLGLMSQEHLDKLQAALEN